MKLRVRLKEWTGREIGRTLLVGDSLIIHNEDADEDDPGGIPMDITFDVFEGDPRITLRANPKKF